MESIRGIFSISEQLLKSLLGTNNYLDKLWICSRKSQWERDAGDLETVSLSKNSTFSDR